MDFRRANLKERLEKIFDKLDAECSLVLYDKRIVNGILRGVVEEEYIVIQREDDGFEVYPIVTVKYISEVEGIK